MTRLENINLLKSHVSILEKYNSENENIKNILKIQDSLNELELEYKKTNEFCMEIFKKMYFESLEYDTPPIVEDIYVDFIDRLGDKQTSIFMQRAKGDDIEKIANDFSLKEDHIRKILVDTKKLAISIMNYRFKKLKQGA